MINSFLLAGRAGFTARHFSFWYEMLQVACGITPSGPLQETQAAEASVE
ncbi:hypothetical protein ACXGPA_21930 (plasmid) [Enterobacter asburiae]